MMETARRARMLAICCALVAVFAPAMASADSIDDDLDGYCDSGSCSDGSSPGDCNDSNAAIHPGAIDVPGDVFDQNCSGKVRCYFDVDNDTYGGPGNAESDYTAIGGIAVTTCASSNSDGWDNTGDDCDDAVSSIHPGATEIPGNGIDEDCNGSDGSVAAVPTLGSSGICMLLVLLAAAITMTKDVPDSVGG